MVRLNAQVEELQLHGSSQQRHGHGTKRVAGRKLPAVSRASVVRRSVRARPLELGRPRGIDDEERDGDGRESCRRRLGRQASLLPRNLLLVNTS